MKKSERENMMMSNQSNEGGVQSKRRRVIWKKGLLEMGAPAAKELRTKGLGRELSIGEACRRKILTKKGEKETNNRAGKR